MTDYKKYEAMAKLDLSEADRQWLTGRVDKMLADFSALESIDTKDAEPLVTVLDIQNVFRDDVARKSISREEILSGAPEQFNGYFQVPKTLD